MPKSTTHLFKRYLKENASAKILNNFELIENFFGDQFGINYPEILRVPQCGRKVCFDISYIVQEFQNNTNEIFLSPEIINRFRNLITTEGSSEFRLHCDAICTYIQKIGGVNPYFRGTIPRDFKSIYRLSDFWYTFLDSYAESTSDLKNQSIESSIDFYDKLNDFIAYLSDFAPNILKPQIKLIQRVCEKRLSLDVKKDDIFGFGAKKLRKYNYIKNTYYRKYPDYNYVVSRSASKEAHKSDEIENFIKLFYDVTQTKFINNELLLIYRRYKFPDLREYLRNVSINILETFKIDIKTQYLSSHDESLIYIFCRFWLDTTPFNYFLFSQHFNCNLSHLTRERQRQLFLTPYSRIFPNRNFVALRIYNLSAHSKEDFKYKDQKIFYSLDCCFIAKYMTTYNGFVLPEILPFDIAKQFAGDRKLVLQSQNDYTLTNKQKKKRQLITSIIQKFVTLYENTSLTSAHIAEELEKYGYQYPSNYIPGIVKRYEINIRQRLNWTWVVRDGEFDVDPPGIRTLFEFFDNEIGSKRKSFNEALSELRVYYPDYSVRNGLALLGATKDNSIYTLIMTKMLLGNWCASEELRKMFYTQIRYPYRFENKVALWPSSIKGVLSTPKLLQVENQHFWLFKLDSSSDQKDLMDHIKQISFNAKALFEVNGIMINIDNEKIQLS